MSSPVDSPAKEKRGTESIVPSFPPSAFSGCAWGLHFVKAAVTVPSLIFLKKVGQSTLSSSFLARIMQKLS